MKVGELVATCGFLWMIRKVSKKFLHLQQVSHITLKPKRAKWLKVSPELVRPIYARVIAPPSSHP